MNVRFFSLLILSAVFMFHSCEPAESVIIAGEVIEQGSGDPIQGAIVEITQPAELEDFATSDSAGNFSFDIDVDETTQVSLEITRQGYQTNTTSFKVAPSTNVDDLSIELASTDGQDDGGGGGGDGIGGGDDAVGGEAGGPAAITLNSISSQTVNVAETGGIVNTAFTFGVQDSAGRAVGQGYEMSFEIIRGPGGGESITPEIGETNPKGTVTSNFFSGDSSGTVRIEAVIERPDVGLTIRSSPVLISISSGFPHPDNFNVGPRVYNFDAFNLIDESHTNNITASVGDKKGNPVKEGTAVYFSSTNGGLVNGSAATNENGYASVNLSANGSTPTGHPMGIGFIDVIAQTIDGNNNYIEKTMTMLLTTPRAIITVNPMTFDIPNGGSQNFDVTITDENGYPMAADTRISVTVGQGLTASGEIVDLEMGNHFEPGPGTTEFSFTVSDSDPNNDDTGAESTVTITVQSPSGEVSTKAPKGTRAKSIGN